ncbi:MAG: CRISPR system precrRNA processing endoribonuclease RAMP protein Cas6 [Desulfosoma sp.]
MVEVRALETVQLPHYRGSSLRGVFGLALKKALCLLPRNDCQECGLRSKCVYMYLFNTEPDHCFVKAGRYRDAPHPFNFQLQVGGEELLERGQIFSFRVTLTGRAIRWLPSFIHAFQIMGRLGVGKGRGRFDLIGIVVLDGRGDPVQTLYPDLDAKEAPMVLGVQEALAIGAEYRGGRQLRLRLLSPLRIQSNGSLCRELSFAVLFRTTLRRLENLLHFHCEGPAFVDWGPWKERIEQVMTVWSSLHWHDWERYSKRQDRRMKLGGLVGEICFRGPLEDFVPALLLGSWLGVGKNTTFGLGTYDLPDLGEL